MLKSIKLTSIIFVSFLLLNACTKELSPNNTSSNKLRELFVIHIHGDWCPTCVKIDGVVHSTEEFFASNPNSTYLVFDESNPETVRASQAIAHKHGLDYIFEHERHTGELLFVEKTSKKILTKFYGVNNKEQYIKAAKDLIAGKDVASIIKEPINYELSKPPVETIKKADLYVVDIHHDMCGSCEITAPTFEKVAKNYKRNKKVSFFTFDLSSPETIKETRALANALGITTIYNNQKHTGEVLFINAKSKELLSTLIMETSSKKYREIIKRSLRQIKG